MDYDWKPALISMLRSIGAEETGINLWSYQNQATQKSYIIQIIETIDGMKQALRTDGAHVIFSGHSNYGLGANFATPAEMSTQTINDIFFIDDDKILNISSPWIDVRLPGMRTSQAYPNWLWIFQDGTDGVMPHVFGDPRGDPPYNYYITYQIPGDPNYYKVNGPIERFPGCGSPAWDFSVSNGTPPDPTNPEHQQYYITRARPWYPSFEQNGAWEGSKTVSGYFKENYIHTLADSSGDTAEWTLRIPQAGNYKIFAWWPASGSWSYNAPYTVNHSSGLTTVFRDQRVNGNRWNEIGEFYFDPGEYPVVLSDDAGGGSVVADALRITHVNDPADIIQANFYAEIRNGPAPLEVNFVNQSTGDITYLEWDFGDGETKGYIERDERDHDYGAGTYTVSLTVWGPSGTHTETKVNYVTVGNSPPPLKAEFSRELSSDTLPLEVHFQDRSSGNIESWFWEFGDGEVSYDQNPTHTYSSPGYYTVSLTVMDTDGYSAIETKQNFISGYVLSRSIDNVDYPQPHVGNDTILFRRELEIPKEEMKYTRLFYNGCTVSKRYLETFDRGIVFYTLASSDARVDIYLKAYLEGKSDEEIWETLQNYDPIFDYWDFSKVPSAQ
jgi:PKD repeat protein